MFYTKAKLEKAITEAGQRLEDALVVSVDLPERNTLDTFKGKKGFYFCRDKEEYLARLQDGEHRHEVLPDKYETKCFVYMDIDEACDGDETTKEQKTRTYVRKVLDAFALAPKDVGKSVQVLTSHAPHKLSIHVVIYIESFPAEVEVRMERVDKSVPWDPSVYSMFRSYRAPYHRKGGKPYRLRPWGNSSERMEDHLIRILPEDPREPVKKLPSINIPEKKKEKLQKRRRAPRGEDDPCRNEVMERLAETRLLEQIGAESFDRVLGASSKKKDCMYVYINNGHVCPIKKAPHSSNRAYVRITGDSITYHCLAPSCKLKGCVSVESGA